MFVCLFYWVSPTLLRSYGNFPAFTGGGRPQVPLCALFHAREVHESRTIDGP